MATKTERLAARLTPEQYALIRRAAEVEGTDLTNFTVTAALAHARDVLADRRLFVLTDAAWTEFLAALDRPVSHKPRLGKLFAERSVFDSEACHRGPGSSGECLFQSSDGVLVRNVGKARSQRGGRDHERGHTSENANHGSFP